jgi:hypothetical protein
MFTVQRSMVFRAIKKLFQSPKFFNFERQIHLSSGGEFGAHIG